MVQYPGATFWKVAEEKTVQRMSGSNVGSKAATLVFNVWGCAV